MYNIKDILTTTKRIFTIYKYKKKRKELTGLMNGHASLIVILSLVILSNEEKKNLFSKFLR